MASSQNRFVLPDSSIAVNLFKYKRYYTLCVRVKKHLMVAFMKMNDSWTLVPRLTSLYLSLTLSIWLWVIMAKLRLQTQKYHYLWLLLALFWLNMKSLIIRKGLPRLLYQNYDQYIVSLGIQIHLLSTRQIFQSRLRVKDDKSGFTFCDKSGDAILLDISNL